MPVERIFQFQLLLGYAAWLLCFGIYLLPWLRSMQRAEAHRVIATLHSFRFFGLAFLVPGVVGPHLPARFAGFAAWGDLTAGLLALLAVATFRIRPLFWLFVVAFNVLGLLDLADAYANAMASHLPAIAGELGVMYAIPVIVVPLLMITHVVALTWLLRPQKAAPPAALAV